MNRIDPTCSRCLDGFACREHQSDERVTYLRAGPNPRTAVLRVRISPEALERVRAKAESLGLDVSTAVRLAVHEWLKRSV